MFLINGLFACLLLLNFSAPINLPNSSTCFSNWSWTGNVWAVLPVFESLFTLLNQANCMRLFSKLLVDNLLIVSGFNFKWFLAWFSNLLVQSTCFCLSSFYRFTRNHFFSKCSNHRSIDIVVLYFYFHCWPMKVFSDEFPCVIIPMLRAYDYLHSLESG